MGRLPSFNFCCEKREACYSCAFPYSSCAVERMLRKLLGSGQQGAPVAPQSLGVRNQPLGTPLHPGHQILFSSHTHWVSSSDGRRKLAKPRGVSSLSGYHTISFSLCQRLSPDFHPSPVIFPLSKGQKSGMIKGTKSGKEGACHGLSLIHI